MHGTRLISFTKSIRFQTTIYFHRLFKQEDYIKQHNFFCSLSQSVSARHAMCTRNQSSVTQNAQNFCTNILLSPTASPISVELDNPLCQQGIAYIAMHSQLSLLTACRTPSYLLPSKISVELHTIHNGYVI